MGYSRLGRSWQSVFHRGTVLVWENGEVGVAAFHYERASFVLLSHALDHGLEGAFCIYFYRRNHFNPSQSPFLPMW